MFNIKLIILVFCLIFFAPSSAYAYLDPGTGNMLIYIIISMVGAAAYFLKNVFYGLINELNISTKSCTATQRDESLIIFSEGKIYWNTFKPIIEALLQLEQPFSYLTMDIEDPALLIENPYLDNRYVGEGSGAFARIGQVRGLVMLSTTPNIGTPGYPLPRPRHVKNLVHVFHGVGDVGSYLKFSLDNYDTVLMVGDYMLDNIRDLEKKRNLTEKTCVSAGLPYLDELAQKIHLKDGISEPPIVLAAPSWGDKNFLGRYGIEPLKKLVGAGYKLIVRPHPYSNIIEPQIMAEAQAQLDGHPNVSFDFEPDGSSSFGQADVMISDLSGVRYDFTWLYQRPVITIDMPLRNGDQYEMSDLDRVWEIDTAEELGPVIKPENLDEIDKVVAQALTKKPEDMAALRNRYLTNFRLSGVFVANWLVTESRRLKEISNA